MGDSLDNSPTFDGSSAVEVTGKVMVVAIIVLFLVVLFVLVLHLYAKWYWQHREHDPPTTTVRRRRFDFAVAVQLGLDPSVLKSIPVIKFDPKQFRDGLECSVCLCEVAEGDRTRLLPKCNHGFHVECIDMWFQSHSTCPICRNPVAPIQTTTESDPIVNGSSSEPPNLPTNVLFWGDQAQVSNLRPRLDGENQNQRSASSSSPNGVVVIDIPRQVNEEGGEEEPKSPAISRLQSFKRLLSRDRRVAHVSSSSNVDVEQEGRSQS